MQLFFYKYNFFSASKFCSIILNECSLRFAHTASYTYKLQQKLHIGTSEKKGEIIYYRNIATR